jgi:hypothetical protein
MSLPLESTQGLYDLFITALQDAAPDLTDTSQGSDIDYLGSVIALAGSEFQRYNIAAFNKTFIDLADGPEITGGPDDLQTLAVDHYGEEFARPGAIEAVDTATFSRPTTAGGLVTIIAGSIVATQPDANGNISTYTTNATVSLAASGAGSLSVSVGITAGTGTIGTAGNATAGTINVIQTSLTDSTIVVTNFGNQSGVDAQDDATYRETIRDLLVALRAAILIAIEAAAKTVPGIVVATGVMIEEPVVFWNPGLNAPLNPAVGGIFEYFTIPFAQLYVADSGGSANPTEVSAVEAAIATVQAFGVNINVVGAVPVVINWTGHLVLNPAGPNYPTLSGNAAQIIQTMTQYIATLGTGVNFVLATARAAILAIWGPAGSNDLTDFSTIAPSGDVAIGGTQNAVPGTIGVA